MALGYDSRPLRLWLRAVGLGGSRAFGLRGLLRASSF